MPDDAALLAEGLRFETNGLLDRALGCYELATAAHAPAVVAEAWVRQSSVYRARCDWDRALETARRGAAAAHAAHLPDLLAQALNAEASVHQSRGHFGAATPLLEQMLGVATNARLRGVALQNLGSIAARSGRPDEAESYFIDSYRCFRAADYTRGEAFAVNNYACAAMDRGNLELAETILERALDLAQAVQDLDLCATVTKNYAEVLVKQGKWVRAEELGAAALGFFQETGNRWRQIECYILLGDANAHQGCVEAASGCYERGLALAREIAAHIETSTLEERLVALRRVAPGPAATAAPHPHRRGGTHGPAVGADVAAPPENNGQRRIDAVRPSAWP